MACKGRNTYGSRTCRRRTVRFRAATVVCMCRKGSTSEYTVNKYGLVRVVTHRELRVAYRER